MTVQLYPMTPGFQWEGLRRMTAYTTTALSVAFSREAVTPLRVSSAPAWFFAPHALSRRVFNNREAFYIKVPEKLQSYNKLGCLVTHRYFHVLEG